MTQVNLSWNAAVPQPGTSIRQYVIYRQEEVNFPPIGFSQSTSFVDTDVLPSTQYTYYVTAIDSKGAVSIASNIFSITTPAVPPPSPPLAPTGLAVTGTTTTTAALSWSASTGATSYIVQRNGAAIASGVTNTTFIDTGLSPSTTYTYTVLAVNSAGSSPASNSVNAKTQTTSTGNVFRFAPSAASSIGIGNGAFTQFTALVDACAANGVPIAKWAPRIFQYDQGTTSANFTGSGTTWGRPFVKACLDYALSKGIFVEWDWSDRTFGSANSQVPGGTYPPWMVTAGWARNFNPVLSGNLNSFLDTSIAACNSAMIAMHQDFGSNFNPHPALLTYGPGGESGVDPSACTNGQQVFTNNQVSTLMTVRSSFKGNASGNAMLRWTCNNTTSLSDLWTHLDALAADVNGGYVIGGPDPGSAPGVVLYQGAGSAIATQSITIPVANAGTAYNNARIAVISGTGAGQTTSKVTAFTTNATSTTLTVQPGFSTLPNAGSVVQVFQQGPVIAAWLGFLGQNGIPPISQGHATYVGGPLMFMGETQFLFTSTGNSGLAPTSPSVLNAAAQLMCKPCMYIFESDTGITGFSTSAVGAAIKAGTLTTNQTPPNDPNNTYVNVL